jgi:dTDP-4-dehydrorhamnose reductase
MRVVIIGASGQLGSDLMAAFADLGPVGVDHAMFDIEHAASISKLLLRYTPDVVINTAAFHNVELCEARPDRAFAVNTLAVDSLAAQCAVAGAVLVHISTDYVFDGTATRPYREDDAPNPLSAYGISKYSGELCVRRNLERAFVVRTSGLYGIRGSSTKGYTFIERMLDQAKNRKPIRVVTDISFSPSYTLHVAQAIRRIVESGSYGIYHVTNDGACTWHEFAVEILRQAGVTAEVEKTTSDQFPTLAKRPKYSPLAHAAIERLKLPPLPRWQDGIGAYLAARPT